MSAGPNLSFMSRRAVLGGSTCALGFSFSSVLVHADTARGSSASMVLRNWFKLVLELVRHTATYSPPVASRSFAYLGITAHEVMATSNPLLRSLAGQVTALAPLPDAAIPASHDPAITLNAALSKAVRHFFGNTGPSGQRAMDRMQARLTESSSDMVSPERATNSQNFGDAIADHIIDWSASDGGAAVENMGFPVVWTVSAEPGRWVPTSTIGQQQAPLLPTWGQNRAFSMPQGSLCPLPPPPAYSEDPDSEFYAEAFEVAQITGSLTEEQKFIARFWSDDPMLSPTPPGHWIAILLQIADRDDMPAERLGEGLALLGIGLADAFIACWHEKFVHDLIRPVTYIRQQIDPAWQPLLITPPFPEYPSGHSTQSGAAATVLTAFLGDDFAFTDTTHEDEGLDARSYPDFWTAAEEAGISRLYGGIHFRSAIERGLEQGRCVGDYATRLQTLA